MRLLAMMILRLENAAAIIAEAGLFPLPRE
jgi:hypothetical protein